MSLILFLFHRNTFTCVIFQIPHISVVFLFLTYFIWYDDNLVTSLLLQMALANDLILFIFLSLEALNCLSMIAGEWMRTVWMAKWESDVRLSCPLSASLFHTFPCSRPRVMSNLTRSSRKTSDENHLRDKGPACCGGNTRLENGPPVAASLHFMPDL